MKKLHLITLFIFIFNLVNAQHEHLPYPGYWQQHVDYKMDIDMDVNTYKYQGKQILKYTNNSPDTLHKVFYHLYFNAFQPGSEMDARLQSISDPDYRMVNNIGTKENPIYQSRIATLKPNEIGYIKVKKLTQNDVALKYQTVGTILEVDLNTPILPGETTTFYMEFEGQVPLQIRRSGRNSREGVALSMAQWYPKIAEYDFEGWHTDPYIAREFHGVWGNFDVKITIDKDYVLGGTGYLQNPNEIGHGYQTGKVKRPKGKKLTWHFYAPNVHDFTWAADPNFTHDIFQMNQGPTLHFLYKKDLEPQFLENWKKLQPKTAELMQYFNTHIGKYPYKQYSVIQGGDGGMEYGMCTLITGQRKFESLVGVTAHELAHSWFQFILATNETKHEWMDEGFAEYICNKAYNEVMKLGQTNTSEPAFKRYLKFARYGMQEPLTTHADRYAFNSTYSISAYTKGEVFLAQLGYVIGEENLKKTLKEYYKIWAFKHPTPMDFLRVAEKTSGIELDWYLMDFIQTTKTIDYAVENIEDNSVTLTRIGPMPMPIDIKVNYSDGTSEAYYIPLQMMRGEKPTKANILKDWAWAHPKYHFKAKKTIESVEIAPNGLLADVNLDNNFLSIKNTNQKP